MLQSENMGSSVFSGPGAGRYPTANSVMNDLIRISQHKSIAPFPFHQEVTLNNDYAARFYIRITANQDGIGIIR